MGRKKIIKEVIAEIAPAPEPQPQPEPHKEPINEPIELKPTIQSDATTIESESDTESIIVASKRKILSDKTKDALKKGREKLAEK
jgi:hypothetical protein